MLHTTNAFITGSHAYGEPREDSDIDLVVYVDQPTHDLLAANGFPVRFGNLNIIPCVSDSDFEAWREGTRSLVIAKKLGGPVSREQAVALFKSKRVRNYDGSE